MCYVLEKVTLGTGLAAGRTIKLQNNIFGTGEVPTPNMELIFGANVSVVYDDNLIQPEDKKFAWDAYPYKSIEYKGNTLTLNVNPSSVGKVIAKYNDLGTEVTLTATANDCYKFVNWTSEGVEPSTENPQENIGMDGDDTFTANFEKLKYNLTVTAGANGSVTPEGTETGIDCGTKKTITATPADGYQFVNWTDGDNTEVSDNPSYEYTIIKTATLTANFAEIPAAPKKPFMKIRMKFLNSETD
jgi:hypothetical protein